MPPSRLGVVGDADFWSVACAELIRGMFSLAAAADGLSLNSVLAQCTFRLSYYAQVSTRWCPPARRHA
jgi:hypothetical protein